MTTATTALSGEKSRSKKIEARATNKRKIVITCRYCQHPPFPDYTELAAHIIRNRKTHRGGVTWARRFLTKDKQLSKKLAKKEAFERMRQAAPATDDQKNALARLKLKLSGETEMVITICLPGKHTVAQLLPVEYTRSPWAYRIQGRLVVTCPEHRRDKF